MHRVEALRLGAAQLLEAHRDDTKAFFLDAGDHLAGHAVLDAVGLHDRQCPLQHAVSSARDRASNGLSDGGRRVHDVDAGLRNAFIFSTAVPFPPEMIAPA
jgi:hypothetical protein